jgi:hypothetical protein
MLLERFAQTDASVMRTLPKDFIERTGGSLGDVALRFFPQEIEFARGRIGFNLPIPRIIEVEVGELFEQGAFLVLG